MRGAGSARTEIVVVGGMTMGRRVVGWFAGASLALLAACGGGGGGGSSSGGTGGVPTPLPNLVCDETNRVCISVDQLIIFVGDTTNFTVTVKDAAGRPQQGVQVVVTDGAVLQINNPSDVTDADGLVHGTVRGVLGGSSLLTATAGAPPTTTSAAVRLSVQGAAATATVAPNTPGGPGTATPTPGSIESVTTIFMETDPFTVSSQNGNPGVKIFAHVFNQDNRPLNNINLLFDFSPKVGRLKPIFTTTRRLASPGREPEDGVAMVELEIPPGVAPPGPITVTASAGEVQGEVTFNITPGAATVEIETVLAQISDATCGADVGGGLTLSAIVFDADNNAMNDLHHLSIKR